LEKIKNNHATGPNLNPYKNHVCSKLTFVNNNTESHNDISLPLMEINSLY